MTVPQPSFGPNGFVVPAEADILVAVKAEINAAFDNELNMADETPQGQLAVSQTAAIGNANDAFAFLAQQFDPAYNSGRYQDAIARIYFLPRIPARATVATVSCAGLSGVVIPAGALVLNSDGNQYAAVDGGTIPDAGTIDLQFQCNVPGPIPCPAGTLTTIYQSVNGWDSAINNADGVIGRDEETPPEFERRRALSVAQNSQGSLPSVLGAVLSVPGVLDAFVTENVNQTPQSIKGFTLNPNSIYVAAVGGTDADVAHAMWTKKSPGCGYNGNTTVVVEDTSPVYNPPYPSYTVKFERPVSITIIFAVTLVNNQSVPANAVTLIQNAIVAAFAGEDGGPRATIGSNLFASRFYGAVAALGSWAQIFNIKIGGSNAPAATFVGSISGSILTLSSLTTGVIGVGQQVVGAGVVPGTTILSGAGLVWQIDTIQTAVSGIMTSVVATNDEQFIQIDQSPVIAPGNIKVILL